MLPLNPDAFGIPDAFTVLMVTTGNCSGGPIGETEFPWVSPFTCVIVLPSTSTKPRVRRILLMIVVFMLVIRFVCLYVVYMFVCNNVVRRSIHSYRIGKVIFPESDLLLS